MDTLGENTVTSPEGDSALKCQCHLPPDRLSQAAATKERSAQGCLHWLPVYLFIKLSATVLCDWICQDPYADPGPITKWQVAPG